MGLSEFQIIRDYFELNNQDKNTIKGIGDDCAVLGIPSEYQLAISMDTLVAGVHFPIDTSAYDIGYKALAVNLSDLAAMGATPKWMMLSLSINKFSEKWLKDFSQGLFECAKTYNVSLVGGDIVCSDLSITIQVHGWLKRHKALYRNGAQVGDTIYVSNPIGEAAAGLYCKQNNLKNDYLLKKLNQPEPQILLGKKLIDVATSCIDISDGLSSDLGHILKQSKVGAKITINKLKSNNKFEIFTDQQKEQFILNGGDDYQLCFTTNEESKVEENFPNVIKIGKITQERMLKLKTEKGYRILVSEGYNHFA